MQLSTNKILLPVNIQGQTFNTNIAEVGAANAVLKIVDIELHEWAVSNKFARFWYCRDLRNHSILKIAIEKAIIKSPHDVQQRHLFPDEDNDQQIQFLGFVSSHRTSYVLNSFHIHSFAVFYTDKKKRTIVTCILTSRVHMLSNMQDRILQLMQLIQFWSNGNFQTAITNKFIRHDVVLDKIPRNGYESMGFDASPLTQDKEQDLFTIKTPHPIPLARYYDRYTWRKYGHHILPSTISLNRIENFNTHGLYRNALQQLLCTDLDGIFSTSLNPPTTKLDKYLSTFFRGKSKTTSLGNTFDKFMKNPESKELFGAKVKKIALSATIIPLSLFTNLFTKKFPKHAYLESTHELMQQVYIKMETEPGQFCLFPGDLSIYSLKCIRCCRSITSPESIGETLYHAPIAMLNHWNMIVRKDTTVDDIASIPLDIASILFVCTSLDSYYQAMNSCYQAIKGRDYGSFCFPNKGCRHGQLSFCEAVKVDMSKVMSHTITPKGEIQYTKIMLPILCPL